MKWIKSVEHVHTGTASCRSCPRWVLVFTGLTLPTPEAQVGSPASLALSIVSTFHLVCTSGARWIHPWAIFDLCTDHLVQVVNLDAACASSTRVCVPPVNVASSACCSTAKPSVGAYVFVASLPYHLCMIGGPTVLAFSYQILWLSCVCDLLCISR